MKKIFFAALMMDLFLLTGCGQSGRLYLPVNNSSAVAVHSSAAPSPAAKSAATSPTGGEVSNGTGVVNG